MARTLRTDTRRKDAKGRVIGGSTGWDNEPTAQRLTKRWFARGERRSARKLTHDIVTGAVDPEDVGNGPDIFNPDKLSDMVYQTE